jgi:hypothetical protein
MKILRNVLVLLLLLILLSIAGRMSFDYVKTGGTTNVSELGPYSFSVNSSDFNSQGYYKKSNLFNIWRIQTTPACGINGCVCGSLIYQDSDYIEAHGWPLSFAYYHISCGSLNVYLVIPMIIDLILFTVVLSLIAYVIGMFIKHIKVRSTKLFL